MREAEPSRLRFARSVCTRMQPFGAGKVRSLLYPYERAQRDSCTFEIEAKTGSTFRGNTADLHAYPFAVSACGEWRNWAVALALCGPGDLIVEVGADVGTESVGHPACVGAVGSATACEPSPSNLDALASVVAGLRHRN